MKRKKKIFIVEDEESLSKALEQKLKLDDYEVHKVKEGGGESYKKIIKVKPDLILLDILLPKGFGLELLDKIRKNDNSKISEIPAIVITNYPESHYEEKAKELNVHKFITKSQVDLGYIVNVVNDFFKF